MTKESKNPQSQAKNPTSKGKKAGSSKGIKLNKVPDRASKAEPEIRNGNFWSMTIRPEMGRVQIGVDLRYVYLMIGNHGPGTIAITNSLGRYDLLPHYVQALRTYGDIEVECTDKKSTVIDFQFHPVPHK
jgi:hypothetical protein